MCHKFCDNHEDAEEVVQDTFLIAFKKTSDLQFNTFTAYLAYLRKIAIHESFRKRKASSRRAEYFVPTDKLPEDYKELDENILPVEALSNKERSIELIKMVESLPRMQNEMIYLYYFVDFSIEEIAALHNCSESNVYNTLQRGRQTLKTKLVDKDKKALIKLTALVPLGALFLIEEQAFAATYTPTAYQLANAAAAETIGTAAATTGKAKISIAVACAVTVGITATVLYFASPQLIEDEHTYEPYEPVYNTYTPDDDPTEEFIEEEPMEEIAEEPELLTVEEEQDEEPEQELEEVAEYVPQAPQVVEEPTPPPHIEETPPTAEPYEPTPEEESPTEPEVVEPPPIVTTPEPIDEPTDEPTKEDDPEPVHIDRTAEILAALATANNAQNVNRIISYFNFTLERQMFGSMDERFRFYVTNEGSGDILIGIAALEDGTGWRMQFEHYAGGRIPSSVSDLLRWIE